MNEQNNSIAGIDGALYNSRISLTEQLEKLNKVRESLYSQSGWSSENVNQSSKWHVDIDDDSVKAEFLKYNHEIGTCLWNNNIAQIIPSPIVAEPYETSSRSHLFNANNVINVDYRFTMKTIAKNDENINSLNLTLETLNINDGGPEVIRTNHTYVSLLPNSK